MSRDDYYVIVTRILVYLYARLKGKTQEKPETYLVPMTEDFPISETYFYFVLREMKEHHYIRLNILESINGEPIIGDMKRVQITQEGIDFLQDNSKARKVLDMIPMASSIIGLFR